MRAYIIRRLLLIVPTLFILSILVFLSVRFLPGDAIDAMLGKQEFIGAEVDRAALEHMLGLDVPVHVQYGRWIGGILRHGSLGHSLFGSRGAVEEKIADRLPVTIELGVLAIIIGLVIALPVGIYSAMRQDTAADYVGARSPSSAWRRPTSGWRPWSCSTRPSGGRGRRRCSMFRSPKTRWGISGC